jgi:hypothetical protein
MDKISRSLERGHGRKIGHGEKELGDRPRAHALAPLLAED